MLVILPLLYWLSGLPRHAPEPSRPRIPATPRRHPHPPRPPSAPPPPPAPSPAASSAGETSRLFRGAAGERRGRRHHRSSVELRTRIRRGRGEDSSRRYGVVSRRLLSPSRDPPHHRQRDRRKQPSRVPPLSRRAGGVRGE